MPVSLGDARNKVEPHHSRKVEELPFRGVRFAAGDVPIFGVAVYCSTCVDPVAGDLRDRGGVVDPQRTGTTTP
jgi:hypothetical protein